MNNSDKCNTNNVKMIPLMILIVSTIIIILLIVFSLNIYAANSNENVYQNMDNNMIIEETANSNIKNENVLQVILNDIEEVIPEVQEESLQENDISTNEENTNTSTINTTTNKQDYSTIATLNIPSLGIKYPILSKTTDELLKISLNKYWGANPNEVGNMVVVGHNFKDGRFFSKLPNIQKNAIIQITDLNGRTLEYKVYDTKVIDPYDNACTSQLTNGCTEITLITCYYENGNVHATKRFYVKARAN